MSKVLLGDCLDIMKDIPDKSIDMILCDLPYGTSSQDWDTVIEFESLWLQYKRIIKKDCAIVLTASQPFIMSNLKMFRYSWVWNKKISGNPLIAKHQPLKIHEDILVFSINKHNYYPKMRKGKMKKKGGGYSKLLKMPMTSRYSDEYYPTSILEFTNAKRGIHPTQKPVELFEYLIETYTEKGDIVLDNCAGSGTTAIAAINTGRDYILIEKEAKYIEVINERLSNVQSSLL